MTGSMLLTLTAVLGAVLAGLGYLGHRGNRPVPAKIAWAACLTILSACAWWAVGGGLVGGTSAAAMPWVQLAAGLCGALFALLVADHLLIGEYLIQRRGRYLPELARTLVIGVGLACVTLVLLDTVLNINVIALVALPTVATAVVGVALKDVFARFFAGIQLGKMIRVGDWISTLKYEGMVTAVGAEHVSLLTREQDLLMLPHDRIIEGGIKNFTRPTPVHISSVTVSATSKMSPIRVCAVLAEAAGAVNGVVPDPQPVAYVTAFTDSGIEYQLRWAITDCSRRLAIKSQVLSYVWNAFQRNGIDIPFPQRIVHHASETAPAGASSMSGHQLFNRLRAIDLFGSLSDEQVRTLAHGASIHQYLPGERVVRQGEPGQELYVILNGTADVAVRHDGLVTTIATMEPGQFFGEISFLTGAPRSSTVTATTTLGVLSIGRESISAVMHGNEKLVEEMSGVVAKRQLVSQIAIDQMSKESQAQALMRQQQSLMERIRRYFWG